jgi:Flp pilus assembly protein TadD/SAM-dependent methyltransferase
VSAQPKPQELNALIDLFKAGRLEEAAARAESLTVRFPRHGVSWKILGVALMQMGRSADALSPMRKAAALLPQDAESHNNLGITLNSLGRHEEAEASCRRALAINPEDVQAHGNLGVALQDRGAFDAAEASYRRALELAPDYAKAHNNLGALLQSRQRLDEAEACFRNALAQTPDDVEALDNLAALLNIRGQSVQALEFIMRSLQIRETVRATRIFAACIKRLNFSQAHPQVRNLLIRALNAPWDRPVELAHISTNFVKLDPQIGQLLARASTAWPDRTSAQALFGPHDLDGLAADELFCALLTATPICDMGVERLLTLARRAILFDTDVGTSLNFHSALAQQCFINEYVFSLDEDEVRQASALAEALENALATEAEVPVLWPLTVAAYMPLGSLPSASRLLERQWPAAVAAVLVQQLIEPSVEQVLRPSIPTLSPIENAISLQVQQQYEENPYPRWIKAAPVDETYDIDTLLKQKFPLARFRDPASAPRQDILIAGCGTGQHSINRARTLPDARILAIDLSLGSLAYAKRKTHEMGLGNIEYAQADLLKLGELGRDFDVIESIGVLHHLDDPWEGWRTLLSLLRPGGLMCLGFYSALARQHIVRIRHFIAEHGYAADADGIRRCRQDLMALTDQAAPGNLSLGNLLKVTDFYSTSSCRDLLFHVQEHQMSLPGIAAFLSENELNFLGFEVEPDTLNAYRQRYPNDPAAIDLAQWQAFEQEHPDTFFGMYQFWVQK